MLAFANLRTHWSSFLGAFTALALGVGLITMTLLVYVSSAPKVPARVAGTPVLAVAAASVDVNGVPSDRRPWTSAEADDLAARLGQVPGVAEAVVDRSFYAQVVLDGKPVADPDAQQAGHGWSSAALAPYHLVAGEPPAAVGEVAIDAALGVAPGATVRLLTGSGPRDLRVTGTVNGPGFYLSDPEAAALAPGVRVIGLRVEPGAAVSAVRRAAGGVVGTGGAVVTGADRSVLEPESSSHTRWLGTQLITAMALLGSFVTVFVVASTFALGAAARRRELGLLRTIGATPRQIRRMILGEALLIGIVGAIVGAVVGVLAAPGLGWLLLRMDLQSPGFAIRTEPGPILVAVLVGVGVAMLGAGSASYRAARVAPMEALRDAQVEKRPMTTTRWILGGGALGVGALLAVLSATATADNRINLALCTAMVLTVAAALLAPVVIGPLVRVATWPARRAKGAGVLIIRAELLNSTRRTASTAAPIIATVGFAVLLSGMVSTMRVAYPAGEAAKLGALSVVAPDGTPGLTDAVVTEAGAGRSSLPTRVFLDAAGQGLTVLDGVGSTDQRYAEPGSVFVAESVATRFGLRPGETLPLTFADGVTQQLRVAALLPDESAGGDLVLARDLVRAHDGSALTGPIFIPRADVPANLGPGARVQDAEPFASESYAKDNRLLTQFSLVLILVSVGYTGIAVANTMAMAARARRTDFAVLKSAGATVRQVLRLAIGETTLVVAVGAVLGMLVTLPPLAGMAAGLAESTAVSVELRMHWPTVGFVIVSCLLLAVAANVPMTWNSTRHRSAD